MDYEPCFGFCFLNDHRCSMAVGMTINVYAGMTLISDARDLY